MINITKINANITFKKYAFARVKNTSGASAVAYTDTSWVGKTVSIIPMKLNVTDRYIESCKDEETGQYELYVETDVIFKKTVNKGKNIGRLHFPKEFAGLDVLIIEAPQIENLY